MSKEILAVIAAIVGGLLTGLFGLMRSDNRSNADERISFRTDILSRLKEVETRTKHLEEEVTIWKIRYWSLYARALKDYEVKPPKFHKMDLQELEGSYKEAIEKLNN